MTARDDADIIENERRRAAEQTDEAEVQRKRSHRCGKENGLQQSAAK